MKKKPSSVSTVQNSGNVDNKHGQLLDMVSKLKNTQNKIISSPNSWRDSIKSQEIKFDSKLDLFSKQLVEKKWW